MLRIWDGNLNTNVLNDFIYSDILCLRRGNLYARGCVFFIQVPSLIV